MYSERNVILLALRGAHRVQYERFRPAIVPKHSCKRRRKLNGYTDEQ
jgi:hypothetical protein